MTEIAMNTHGEDRSAPGAFGGWLQVLAIVLLLVIGGILGALTGFIPLSPIGSVVLPLAAATWFLRREGNSWRSLVIGMRLSVAAIATYAALTLLLLVGSVIVLTPILHSLGVPPADYSALVELLEGNLTLYLWMLLPVSLGSAAIGEELVLRGFLQHRLTGLSGAWMAVVLQALFFAAVHFYQGIGGMIEVFVVGLVFGALYLRSGRNLIPIMIAHGLIDAYGVTVLYLGRPELLAG
jgi:hypothetical protein